MVKRRGANSETGRRTVDVENKASSFVVCATARRSTSSLGPMLLRSTALIGAGVVFFAASAWVLIPPFPSPAGLMDLSFTYLTARLGPPTGSIPTKFVVWEKSRGIAMWSLEVGFDTATVDPTALPQNISRRLWVKWAGLSVPYGYAVRARVSGS
jgi:hypothetical protein